jgi:3-dehydroquinate synthase
MKNNSPILIQINFKVLINYLLKSKFNKIAIICDTNTMQLCLPTLFSNVKPLINAEIIEVDANEENKSIETATFILETLFELEFNKSDLIINLGGGVITDLGGFVASIYKRGVNFLNIPTTLLAMVDASVGGKNGINFFNVKNSIGTIVQPNLVYINNSFLKTLPIEHYQNGMAEIFKIALVNNKTLWNKLQNRKSSELELIKKAISLKENIVKKDPLEKGLRKILNFGHTIAHAIEMLYVKNNLFILHGYAVVIGMIVETHIAYQKKLISKDTLNEVVTTLVSEFTFEIKIKLNYLDLKAYLIQDKKNKNGNIKMALLTEVGKCKYDITVSEKEISKALLFFEGTN